MSDKTPVFADENGVVTGYMCLTDFYEEIVLNPRGTAIYPSEAALRERKHCAESCGIVRVGVKIADTKEKDPDVKVGFMDYVTLMFELGGAVQGGRVYPTAVYCRKYESYGAKQGPILTVEVRKLDIVCEHKEGGMSPQEVQTRLATTESWERGVNKEALAVELATRLRDHLKEWLSKAGFVADELIKNAPPTGQPSHLLQLLDRIERYAISEHWADSKLHRYIGAVQDSMIWLGAATVHDLKEIMFQAKKHFLEKPDKDLLAHHDPDSPFELDIGGESG